LPAVKAHRPDVVLLRFDAGDCSLSLMPELPRVTEVSRTLVLTSVNDAALHARAIELGAAGVLSSDQPGDVLVKAIKKVHAGELWLDRAGTAGVVKRLAHRHGDIDPDTMKIASLTRREREIVSLVAEGLNNKDIAGRLCISEATARNHLTSILDKLELANRFELAVYAFRRGLVSCPQTPVVLRISSGWK